MVLYFVSVIVLIVLVCVLLLVRYQQKKELNQSEPYRRRLNFYSNTERTFLAALMRALGGQYLILGKVKVSDLIGVDSKLNKRQQIHAYESLMGKTVDFVLCDHRTSKILAVIDLVDTSKGSRKTGLPRELDLIFKSVGVPCIRFYCAPNYDVSDIRYAVGSFLTDLADYGPIQRMMT